MNNQNLNPTDESVFDVLDMVRAKPGLYFGATSLSRLHAFLAGYDSGLGKFGAVLSRYDEFYGFHQWIADKLGCSSSTSGWCNMILKHSENEEDAFHRFYEFLDQYRKEKELNSTRQP